MIYAQLVKSKKYINAQSPSDVCIFDLWRKLVTSISVCLFYRSRRPAIHTSLLHAILPLAIKTYPVVFVAKQSSSFHISV